MSAHELGIDVSSRSDQRADRFSDPREMAGPIRRDVEDGSRLPRRADTSRCELGMFLEQCCSVLISPRWTADFAAWARRLSSGM